MSSLIESCRAGDLWIHTGYRDSRTFGVMLTDADEYGIASFTLTVFWRDRTSSYQRCLLNIYDLHRSENWTRLT